MMLRVYAIWGQDRRILAVLTFFWIVQVAFCSLALVYTQRTYPIHTLGYNYDSEEIERA